MARGGTMMRQFMLVLEMLGLEASVMAEVLLMIGNLQTLGVPISATSIPGTVSASIGSFSIPALGIFMDKYASSLSSKAKILFFTSSLPVVGNILVFSGNYFRLTAPSSNQSIWSNQTWPSAKVNTNSTVDFDNFHRDVLDTPVENDLSDIPFNAVLAMIGYALIDNGYDSSNCFLKTFALECTPQKDHSSVIIKSVIVSSFGGVLISILGSVGVGKLLTEGTDLDPNAATAVIYSSLSFFLLVASLTVTLSTGFCCPPKGSRDSRDEKTPLTIKEDETLDPKKTSFSYSRNFADVAEVSGAHMSVPQATSKTRPKGTGLGSFIRKYKKQIIINITTFFLIGSLYSYEVYSPNFVGMSIYGGDPKAALGSELYDRYITGLEVGAQGSLVYYITFTCFTFFLEAILNKFGASAILLVSASVQSVLCLVVAITCNVWLYYVSAVWLGVFRSASAALPYVLASQCAAEENGSNTGAFISVVAAMLPIAFTICSAVTGPLIEATGNPATSMYYTSACSFLGVFTYLFIYIT